MEERRRTRRTDLTAKLVIKRLDDGKNADVAVEITDVSKSGIGFTCPEPLTIGAVYEADLKIWTDEIIHAFLCITRIEVQGNTFGYGAIFIGMAEIDACRIGVYQTFHPDEQE